MKVRITRIIIIGVINKNRSNTYENSHKKNKNKNDKIEIENNDTSTFKEYTPAFTSNAITLGL